MDDIDKRIKVFESQIDKRSLKDRDINLSKSIPGIGIFKAFLVKLEIDDIYRLSSKEKICSYVVLVPSTHGTKRDFIIAGV